MIDVRRVVGRENSNSQTTSLLLLALACGRGGQDRVWSNGVGRRGSPRFEQQERPTRLLLQIVKGQAVIVRRDEVRGERLRCKRNRGWEARIYTIGWGPKSGHRQRTAEGKPGERKRETDQTEEDIDKYAK